ncbi:DUF6364 family protein [Nonlabens ponticola]|uniref:Antitoxin n=1 Tax=Nonlabens ponticola TaxID=2496866 RepID=A0A3S9MXL8_9FLAO|nr:DUF6364 family protein [Nonlabens ponticola]AZQ43991.1 hypothetical protein EJ995_06995 [Nonlabens ponticola]
MDKKLTLSLNQLIIEQAKLYAKKNKTSLSKLIESYLQSVTKQDQEENQITPLIQSLSGVIELENDLDVASDYTDHLEKKYQ